jgi:hypothetical protein
MGYKSRSNWPVNICLRKCANRDKKCENCIKWSEYKELKDDKKNNNKSLNA